MTNELAFRPDLQGLRAIAILLVVLSHSGFEAMEGGFIGVDIFFVLSGYLITGLLVKEYETTQGVDFLRFYARRIKRLLPSLLLVILVTFLVASVYLSSFEFLAKTRSSFYALTWLSNIYFAFTEVGYFAEMEQQDLFLHTWSLGVEEQFYIFWPALIFGLLTLGRFFHINTKSILWLSLVLIFSSSLLLCLYWGLHKPLWSFYLMPARTWQFSLGALMFILGLADKRSNDFQRMKLLVQIFALAAILVSAAWINSSMIYPGWVAIFPSLAAALIMFFPVTGVGSGILNQQALIYIGDRSYAWYLWHWPVFGLAKSCGLDSFWYQKLFLIVLSLLLAMLSYRLIELRFWKGRYSKFSDVRTIVAALVALLAMAAVMLNTLTYHQRNSLQASSEKLTSAAADIPIIYSYGCDSWYESAATDPCVFADESFKKTFVLFGDSVLGQWFSLFSAIYAPPEWRVIVYTKSACPIVDEDYFYSRIGSVYDVCRTWRDQVLSELTDLKPDVVVIGNSANHEFSEDQWVRGSARIFQKLNNIASRNYVLLGTPALGRNGPACLLGSEPSVDAMRKNCSGTSSLAQAEKVAGYLASASDQFNSVQLLDFNELVCPDDQCYAITHDGVVIFRDSQHLTDTFARGLLGEVLQRYPELLAKESGTSPRHDQ